MGILEKLLLILTLHLLPFGPKVYYGITVGQQASSANECSNFPAVSLTPCEELGFNKMKNITLSICTLHPWSL